MKLGIRKDEKSFLNVPRFVKVCAIPQKIYLDAGKKNMVLS